MFQGLKKMFQPEQSASVNVNRLIRPMLANYARTHGGSFMLLDKDSEHGPAANAYEIYCIFPKEATAAAAEYAQRLMDGLGLPCLVSTDTHKELLNHLRPQASFIYERRSPDRQIA